MPTIEQLKKQLLELGILTLITVVVWTIYGVYSALNQPSQSQVSNEELKKVDTNLDLELLDRLKNRLTIDDETLSVYLESRYGRGWVASPSALPSFLAPQLSSPEASESATHSATGE